LSFIEENSRPNKLKAKTGEGDVNIDEADILFFPSWGILPFTYSKPDSRKEAQRARTLSSLLSENKSKLVITSMDAVVQKIPVKECFEKSVLSFNIHEKYNFNSLTNVFDKIGYDRVDLVENYGQFCVKGNILDIFLRCILIPYLT
jgi:transcription-repair coupling factor (superfamily II helicase)